MRRNQAAGRCTVRLRKKSNGREYGKRAENHQQNYRQQQDLVAAFLGHFQLFLGGAEDGSYFAIWCCVEQGSGFRVQGSISWRKRPLVPQMSAHKYFQLY